MAIACYLEEYREKVEREIIKTKKIDEEYKLLQLPHIPYIPHIGRIEQGQVDHNSNWAMNDVRLLTSQMGEGCGPWFYKHSMRRVIVRKPDPKVDSNVSEDMREVLKMREELFSSLPKKDIPREEMDIEEDIHDNNKAAWAARFGNSQWVRIDPTAVEVAEATTDFTVKIKLEEDTEVKSSLLTEDARAEVIEDGNEINPHFS